MRKIKWISSKTTTAEKEFRAKNTRPARRRSRRARSSIRQVVMKFAHRAISIVALAMPLIGIAGCMEHIALIGRPTIVEGQSDVRAEVERVDRDSRRLYLRPDKGERRVIAYSADAHVLYCGREYPVTRLEPGDVVALQVKRDGRGESYTDLIRLQENV